MKMTKKKHTNIPIPAKNISWWKRPTLRQTPPRCDVGKCSKPKIPVRCWSFPLENLQLESLTSNTAHGMTSQMVCVISKVFCFAWVMGGISHLCQNGGVDLLLKWGVVGWVRARGVGGSSSLTSRCIVNLQNNCVHYGEGGISSLIIFPCIVRLQIASIIHVSCSPLGINISCSKLMTNWNGDIESNIVYCRVNIRFLLSIFLI